MHFAAAADSIESENLDQRPFSIEDCGFMDPEMQHTMRTIDDANEYPKFGWVDITSEFMSACSELNLGELAQDMLFGLFEAMSAIEMMDPKMDVGMGYNRNDTKPHTFETAVDVTYISLPIR